MDYDTPRPHPSVVDPDAEYDEARRGGRPDYAEARGGAPGTEYDEARRGGRPDYAEARGGSHQPDTIYDSAKPSQTYAERVIQY